MSAPVEEWENYVFGNTGLAGHSEKINEGAVFGHDGHHLCVSDGLLKAVWEQIQYIGKIVDGEISKLDENNNNEENQRKCIYELNGGDDCAELEHCGCSNAFCRFRKRMEVGDENMTNEESNKTEGITFWLSGYQFEVQKIMTPKEAGLWFPSSLDLSNNIGNVLQAVQVTKKEFKTQLCLMKTKKIYLVALAGGTEATDCDLYIPTLAVKEIGSYLIRNGS